MIKKQMRTIAWRFIWCFALGMLGAAVASASELSDALKRTDHVLLIRHALAPGFGDPSGYNLQDCKTQRNLDGNGREQAQRIGKWLKDQGVKQAFVYSSAWCRCKETVQLLGIGQWQTFSGLNSFFQNYADKTKTLRELEFKLKSKDGGMMFLVTHQVVIRAATGASVASGELVAFNSVSQQKKIFRLD